MLLFCFSHFVFTTYIDGRVFPLAWRHQTFQSLFPWFFPSNIFFNTTVLSIKTAFNLVRIHVLFGIVLLIQWSINNSIFVGHVVIYFFSRVQLGRLKTYIHTSSVIRIYAGIHGWRTNENLCNILNPLYNVMISVSVSVDEFLPIKAHLNKRGRLIHHYNKYDA